MNKLRESLNNIFDEMYENTKPDFASLEELSLKENIFIIHSAALNVLESFIVNLKKINNNTNLYIMSHSFNKETITKMVGNSFRFIDYKNGGNYDLDNCKHDVSFLQNENIDAYILLYNNRFGNSYENVEEIVHFLSDDNIYAFNSQNEFLSIKGFKLREKSIDGLNSLIDWFWEYTPYISNKKDNI